MRQLAFIVLVFLVAHLGAQQQDFVDFERGDIAIAIDTVGKTVQGKVDYLFKILKTTDSLYLDARDMEFTDVRLDGRKVNFNKTRKKIRISKKLKPGKEYSLSLSYKARPAQSLYFIGWEDKIRSEKQIWTQGQGKYSSHWVPSLDDMGDKIEFDLRITFNADYEVAANGVLLDTQVNGNLKTWQFDMKRPMSSYLLAFAIGKFKIASTQSASGIPMALYYQPEDSTLVEPTYRYSDRIFNFLENEIGVAFPWQSYRQVPVKDFLYAGMENTGCTLFSNMYVVDSVAFKDRNFVNINAHELAHQWFGDLVTEVSGKDHWLHEGFATYYAYLAEKELFGEEHFYWKFYETARALDRLGEEGGGEALTDPHAGSLTFYEKGAWALYMLREHIGDTAFRDGIVNFLNEFAFDTASVDDFIRVMEVSSGSNLDAFKEKWLEESSFSFSEAITSISEHCKSITDFLALQRELTASPESNEAIIGRYWAKQPSGRWRTAVLKSYFNSLSNDFIREAFNTGDWKIRQAIALETVQIPAELKAEYESLLTDPSYVTVEAVLYKLWIYFDEGRSEYLDSTRDMIGLPNRNVRMLWLTLAMLTPGYDEAFKAEYFKELSAYTSSSFNFETRQMAFEYLRQAFDFTDENLLDLIRATVHHSWQFREFSRNLLDDLLKNERYRSRIRELVKELKEEELRYINQKMQAK